MSDWPTISLVIPNWNSGAVLERCIRSILLQEYPNLQLIMADAGSTDVSADIIDRYRRHFDIVISEPDGGQADGLNKGFRRARGEIHGWLCADDELLPGALEHVGRYFAGRPDMDVLIGRCERVFADGQRYVTEADDRAWDNIVVRNTIEQPSTFWRAELHRRVGELDNSYFLSFDWILWIWFRNAEARFSTSEKVLSRYYFTAENKCNNAGNRFAEETYRLLSEYGPKKGLMPKLFRHIYYRYDLKGCLDNPPSCSRQRYLAYRATRALFSLICGKHLMNQYNWHFASQQERGLKWW